eukprot:CAMPEP_0113635492 /NCGR_PEP_ID=MMETSP0017_2-20120614/18504_1 /TAXON_ID=2856 /ORGANISM="Cylindrotheca closterium" /LENGTH=511 /DNA_ID=CAMNT_0000546281 /DNA_START=72 /DNA_END=1608 /DNA_ORIENTATION=+ /assembly_acc=CAM_ASM_000147
MSDQKAMKKRLKALMALSENQVCVDCPEKKPTWASIIAPPPGAPPGTEKTGAFVCLECSGSHRRLGVHITFVRSVNLDSWKDWEVRAMENGGNTKVNAIFEANLDREKLSNHASGPTRERYIRDNMKDENPAGFSMPGNSGSAGGNGQAPRSAGAMSSSRPGAPSEIARQRVAQRQARMKTAQSQAEVPRPSKPQVAQAPASAPVVMDLLDFGASPAPSPAAFPSAGFTSDPFAAQPTGAQPVTNMATPAPAPVPVAVPPSKPATLAPPPQKVQEQTATQPGSEFLTPAPAEAQPQKASNDSIMALFNTPAQSNAGFGVQPGMMMNNNMGMMGGVMPQQQQQQQQHQQGIMGSMMNPGMQQQNANGVGMMGNGSQMMNSGQMANPQMMMMNGNMQQQQQQMMMMMMQQQQMQMQVQKANNGMNQMNMNNGFPQQGNQKMMGGMMNSLGNGVNNNAMNSMGQSMQQMSLGGAQNQQNSDDGGFGAPMGGNAPQKDDPFSSLGSSLGGMNAFR